MIYSPDLRPVVDDVLGPGFTGDPVPWDTVAGLGWPLVGVPEEAGGVGGDLSDVVEIAAGTGRHAAALPLPESALAAWVLAQVGLPVAVADARAAVARARPDEVRLWRTKSGWELSGRVTGVRWAPVVPVTVVVADDPAGTRVIVLDRTVARMSAVDDVAGEPVGELILDRVAVAEDAVAHGPARLAQLVECRAAVLRAAAIGGAVDRACLLTTEYVRTRHQFGRPLAANQAVLHAVAELSVLRDLVAASVAVGIERSEGGGAVAARATASRAAGSAAAVAHQMHGALGITREHPLHRVTRRLWAWQDAEGSQRHWERALGHAVTHASGDDALWDLVTGVPASAGWS